MISLYFSVVVVLFLYYYSFCIIISSHIKYIYVEATKSRLFLFFIFYKMYFHRRRK